MGLICKIALKTIPRWGKTTLLFFALGFYLIFPACDTWLQVREEKGAPCTLTATAAREYIDLNALLQVEGVKGVSPVLRLEAELSVEDYKLACRVDAVYRGFLNLEFTEGTLFPDSSNMPYVILNKAAAKAFALDEGKKRTVSAGAEILFQANNAAQKGVICGIFEDHSDIPAAYMSYDTAQREYSQGSGTELLLSLTKKGLGEKVVKAAQRLGLSTSFDPNESLRWELMVQQVWQTFMTSIGFIVCAVILALQNWRQERSTRKGEIASLLISGIVENEMDRIFTLRLAVMELCCMCLTVVTAGIVGLLSGLALCVSASCAFVSFIIIMLQGIRYRNARRHFL